EHCGACENPCAFGESCIEGACVPDEVCDGEDNNMDGEIDEGFPDGDGDGIADCVDLECELEMVSPEMVPVDEDCVAPDVEVLDPWNVAIEWQWKPASNAGSYGTPLVGELTDDNNDGVIDSADIPDIVVGTRTYEVYAFNGADGAIHWSWSGSHQGGALVLADVDADGKTEVVTVDQSKRAVALDGETGAVKWTSVVASTFTYPMLATADVDADGAPEVLLSNHLLNGEDGSLDRTFQASAGIPYWAPVAADLDQDDVQEIIITNRVYSPDGTLLWMAPVVGNYGHWVAIVDADDDPEAEVVMIGGNQLGVFNHDGSQIFLANDAAFARPGPVCAGDFDGDGESELAWGSQGTFHMRELSGAAVWSSANINDSSGLAGCSGYDINGDGVYEILFADQDTLWIFDGATGAVNFSQPGHNSGTVFEYPTVADVDQDGSAEILFTSNSYQQDWGALTVMGHNGDGWQPSGPTWNTHDFSVTNVLPNGKVPEKPAPWWQIYNIYRARPTNDDAAVDLRVEIVDVCAAGCLDDSVVNVAVQVFNYGAVDSLPDIPVTLYRKDGDMYEVIETQLVNGAVLGGTGTDGLLFTLQISSIGADGLAVRVDDDGMMMPVQTECDEGNNEALWDGALCGG
ncbi:MAG: PQQ-binding-like beta-propeller repeat protein, partial [Myxococcales bacterium]|nr:PQQ-binding-like beta-propeller repeat protein [Myxococcales bacterium]